MATQYPESTSNTKRGRGEEICGSSGEIRCTAYPGIRTRNVRGEWEAGIYAEMDGQAKAAIVDEFSMATWICGVIVIKQFGEPTHTSLPLVDILTALSLCDAFMVCGEISDKGVHHTHFLLRTNSRLDSVRRSIINSQKQTEYEFDVCKLATCRYWYGMFCYLLKNPLIVFASNDKIANLAFTAIEQGDTIKYLKGPDQRPEGKEVVTVITKIITEHECKTVEDIFAHGASDLVKFLHLSSLESVMKNCLQYTTARNRTWDPKTFKHAPETCPLAIHNILQKQNIDTDEFDMFFWKWICRENGKINTMILQGPSNTGKSCFIRGLAALARAGSIVNTASPFFAEGICGANIGIWEEPLLTMENAEMFKLISEGAPCQLPQKFKKPYNHPGCPIIITTNHDICRYCASEEGTIMNRCKIFWFTNTIASSTGGFCEGHCIRACRAERRSATCYLNWGSSNRHTTWQPAHGVGGNGGPSSSKIHRNSCGRWWCGSDDDRFCSYCSRTKIKRANTGRPVKRTSTTTSRDDRSRRAEYEARSARNRRQSGSSPELLNRPFEQSGPPLARTYDPDWSIARRVGSGGTGSDSEPTGGSDSECSEVSGGWIIYGQTTESEADEREAEIGKTCTCIVEPCAADWQAYLCYLANKYE
uniref:Nonstructural protein 1 n=1 Tax=Hamaparvovirinae sp. TaxID=2809447 RepID=A0AAU7P168_9VIRU